MSASVFLLFHLSSNQKITATKKTWQKIINLAQILPSSNLATKFEFGTWHELGTNLAVIKYHASGISLIVVEHGDLLRLLKIIIPHAENQL